MRDTHIFYFTVLLIIDFNYFVQRNISSWTLFYLDQNIYKANPLLEFVLLFYSFFAEFSFVEARIHVLIIFGVF